MKIFNMAFRNMKSNFKNYWAYFLSCSFSVFVIYLFMSIVFNKNIQANLGGVKKFIILFNLGATMIVVFSAFFIWYSNSFFIKSRKKEFATYMLLGMSSKQVSRLNFLENAIIMVLAFVTGIVFGLMFTKLFIMLLYFMIKVTSEVSFEYNLKAIKLTSEIFAGIFLLIAIHGAILIRNSSLINLFNASKKVERGVKVSLLTVVLGVASIVCLGYGYYLAAIKMPNDFFKVPIVIALVVIGIVLFFTSTTSFVIHINKKNEKKLYKGTRLISVSQLYYRYRGNIGALSIIAITTTVALCALITCIGSYSRCEKNSRYMRPFSVEYFNTKAADKTFEDILKKHSKTEIKSKDEIKILNLTGVEPNLKQDGKFYVINESAFNAINAHQNNERRAKLNSSQDCYFVEVQNFVSGAKVINKEIKIKLKGKEYNMKITGSDFKPFIALDHFDETVVVKDSVFNELIKNSSKGSVINIKACVIKDDLSSKDFSYDLINKMPKDSRVVTFYDHYADGLKLLGMMAFIGLFIGALFIMATGSIIYFKLNMEAREDKSKYKTLMKIGVSKKEIKKSVSKELMILFGEPLLIAVISACPAAYALGKMLLLDVMKSYVYIVIVYTVIYLLYYFVTLNSYIKTIEE
ncbi:FtsX-like permease family protein [Haloimpatiens sp. FM7315]|uniref:FtsX-like permease family protein n=1 Tax=Haloimpatiens sp. FM7315 TaxID=3298609 RepID=UPI00370A26FE